MNRMKTSDHIQQIANQLQALPDLPDIPHCWINDPTETVVAQTLRAMGDTHIQNLASCIDHTLLKADASPDQIIRLCHEARDYGMASVCVNPCYVPLCVDELGGSTPVVCTVVGFPLGATTTETKVFETRQACQHGAQEIDMVLAIGHIVAGHYQHVYNDIRQVVQTCHRVNAQCKVIIETDLLKDEHKIAACLLAVAAGADYVKTSTGFAATGATVDDVQRMRQVVGLSVGVKAAGGVRTLHDAQAMIRAGATRIGTSAGVRIITEAQERDHATSDQYRRL